MAKLTPEEKEKARNDLREEARQSVAARGLLQFRCDPETVLAIIDASDKCKMPVGAMLRQWVKDRLVIESALEKAPDLVQRVSILEDRVNKLIS